MSQCVPTCSSAPNLPISDYEVAELTWENGHLSMHGLGHHRIEKPIPKYPSPTWDKPRAGGTLESVVDQATRAQLLPPTTITSSSAVVAVDAIVPCSGGPQPDEQFGTCVGSCSGRKRARAGNCASQGSATSMDRAESTRVTLNDTCELNGVDEVEVGFTTTNSESPETENTSFRGRPLTFDDHDSVSHSRRSQQRGGTGGEEEKVKKGETVRSSISTKRSRAAAIHNQSERKRRDRINERIKTLQKLVPNSSKTDKASMLDEVIEYLKQLQAQIQMMSKMSNIPHMMTPMTMQQMQMSMMVQMTHMAQMAQMAQMGMGMGLMDLGSLARHGPAGMPHVLPPPLSSLSPAVPPFFLARHRSP